MEFQFFIDTYDTERIKTLSVWSMFTDDDLFVRPHPLEKKDRSPLEHMVHQCASEDKWFCNMFGIDVDAPPLPEKETRLEFIKRYAEDSEYAYPNIKSLIEGESKGGLKARLPGPGDKPCTERPDL